MSLFFKDLLTDFENCLAIETSRSNSKKENVDSIESYLQNCGDEEPYNLTDEMVFKIVVICFMTITKLESKDSSEVRGVIAFTLAILSQLLQTAIEKLQESVIDMSILNGEEFGANNSQFIEGPEKLKNDNHKAKGNGINTEDKKNLLNCDNSYLDINDNRKNLNNIKDSVDVENLPNGAKKTKEKTKSLLTKLRRPRRRQNSSDSDASDADVMTLGSSSDELNSDISETEEDALSEEIVLSDDGLSEDLSDTEGARIENEEKAAGVEDEMQTKDELNSNLIENDSGKDTPEKSVKPNGETEAVLKHDDKDSTTNSESTVTITTNVDSSSVYDESSGSTNTVAYVAQLKKQNLDPADILNVLMGEGTLASIKVCFDWLTNNPDILQSCAKSSRMMLKRVSTLLNLINIETEILLKNSDSPTSFQNLNESNLIHSVEVLPLPEDIELKGLKIFDRSQKKLDWELMRKFKINKSEETLLRSSKLIKFGHVLCATEESGVTYDESKRLFVTSEVGNAGLKNTDSGKDNRESDADHPRGKLMRHMGRLWLKAEVRALESRLRSRLMSPYLVPDHEALSKHMPALKRLVYAKRFIVVIPSVGEHSAVLSFDKSSSPPNFAQGLDFSSFIFSCFRIGRSKTNQRQSKGGHEMVRSPTTTRFEIFTSAKTARTTSYSFSKRTKTERQGSVALLPDNRMLSLLDKPNESQSNKRGRSTRGNFTDRLRNRGSETS